jgi:thiol-disulfide isomerase/thioredoxin
MVVTSTSGLRRQARVRAPEFTGRGWLNTGGEALKLADLRGRIVLLDFWTFCCVNCLHVLDELRPLEEEFADVLVTIGVHSPKFEHEAQEHAVAAAVARYEVDHPVLDDPSLTTWQAYAVQAWPTLVVVDPEGYVVYVTAGEGHLETLRAVLRELVAEHSEKGTLHRGDGPYVPPEQPDGDLRFPAKAVATADGTLLVADAGHHSLVELAADGQSVLRRIGTGRRGAADGPPEQASFAEPGGVALLPEAVAERVGYHAVVADTGNHLLRGVDLDTGEVHTVGGTGAQWMGGEIDGPAREIDLTSPWDLTWWEPAGGVVVAMAGNHTLGLFDPLHGKVARLAGTTVEGLRDGPAAEAFFAQPSGLAADGERLWLVDAETSALRRLERSDVDDEFVVRTAVGEGLFDFGHADGPAVQALLQHPLGVAPAGDGTVLVADTYNGAIRRYTPDIGEVSTVATGFAEPSGITVLGEEILVVASAAHRLDRLPGLASRVVHGAARQVARPVTDIAPGEVELAVVFTPPPGQKVDERYGPATQLEVTASPPELLTAGSGSTTELTRTLHVAPGEGVLQVVARAASCDDDPENPHPVCRFTRQDWGVPVRVVDGGARRLPLMLSGEAEG